jgi:hypothetical protein
VAVLLEEALEQLADLGGGRGLHRWDRHQ